MDINDLFLCPICKQIPPNERKQFLAQLDYKINRYKKGERLVSRGDTVDSLYVLLEGSVETELISGSETTLNVDTIKAPNPLAPAFLFAENNRFPVDIVALEDSQVVLIPKSSVLKQFATNEIFLQSYMAFHANRTNVLSERVKLLSIRTIKGKLAQYILSRTQNNHFVMGMNQTRLAEYFGVTRPSLARCLSEMIEEGAITLKRKEGEVLNPNKLKDSITH
ncbi:MAG: Crp/Fnr family transcriptional regulator [Prevotellaceae bacterium]|jgi:CRP-like cAMP-binding protein|nr:Crp/Fnr family transcriptional regulator [Prevotellaceae bacterium]